MLHRVGSYKAKSNLPGCWKIGIYPPYAPLVALSGVRYAGRNVGRTQMPNTPDRRTKALKKEG